MYLFSSHLYNSFLVYQILCLRVYNLKYTTQDEQSSVRRTVLWNAKTVPFLHYKSNIIVKQPCEELAVLNIGYVDIQSFLIKMKLE